MAETNPIQSPQPTVPNPRRIEAGRRNRTLRRGLTETGRQRLRKSTSKFQPWRFAKGPISASGKQQAVRNGKVRQVGAMSVREIRLVAAELRTGINQLRDWRISVIGPPTKKNMTPN